MLKRLRVRKPPPDTGWTCVTLACCEIAFFVCLKKGRKYAKREAKEYVLTTKCGRGFCRVDDK